MVIQKDNRKTFIKSYHQNHHTIHLPITMSYPDAIAVQKSPKDTIRSRKQNNCKESVREIDYHCIPTALLKKPPS